MAARGEHGRFGTRRGVALALAATAASLLGGGCGRVSAAASRQDAAYLSALAAAAPDATSYRSASALIGLGHAACDGLASGASYQQLADRLALAEGAHPLPSEDLGAVVTTAVDIFCPQYQSKVN